MDTPTVRKSKPGDQLAVGDWLAPQELTDGAAEVLHVLAYRHKSDTHIHLVVREQGKVAPYADVVAGTSLFELATEDDLAELREQAERTAKVADIRAFADWLEARPWAPVPNWFSGMVHLHGDNAIARVRQFGEDADVKVRDDQDDRTQVSLSLPSVDYSVIAWHRDGRPAEPEDADPTGLNYGRGDEQADPQPTSRRVEPHTGAVVDGGRLVEDGEAGSLCNGAPAGFEADCGRRGEHGPHALDAG